MVERESISAPPSISTVPLPFSNGWHLQVEANAWQTVRLQTNMADEVDGLRKEKKRESRREDDDDESTDRYGKITNDHWIKA